MEVKIAEICGLCNGCKRAIDTVIKELNSNQKVVIFKEIVHNKNFNTILRAYGAVTKENLQIKSSDITDFCKLFFIASANSLS